MNIPTFAAMLALASPLAMGAEANFDADSPGGPPSGWECGATGKGHPDWAIVREPSAPSPLNVLKQSGSATFPWCVKADTETADGTVEVRFKPVSGKEDQAGGVVWRWKDANHYYVARANALEGNVSLYHTTNGIRKAIKSVRTPVAANTWHTLRVTYHADAIEVMFDGKRYIAVTDTHIRGSGKAGVWTKADSVTLFDDFKSEAAH